MTTAEKITAALAAFQTMPVTDLPPEVREVMDSVAILRGFGFDPLSLLVPADPADADVAIDKAIAFLLELRGDDLPPFDSSRYGEGAIA